MTINEPKNLLIDFWNLLLIYIIQLVVSRLLIGWANSLYFRNYVPERTVVLYNDSTHLDKLVKYFNHHKKQYEIIEMIENPILRNLDLSKYDNLFLIDLEYSFLRQLVIDSMMLNNTIYYHATVPYVALSNKETFIIDDVLFFVHKSKVIKPSQLIIKRFIDILFSSVLLLIIWPVLLVVSIVIKLEDGGPSLFTQERVTKNRRIFKIYKFRSMKENSEEKWAEVDDERITKVGKYVRKLRLDELPQLINIMKGDMSVVGPRPETAVLTEEFIKEIPEFEYRLKVKAGLTGTAQVLGKYNTLPKDKLLFDLYYIENFSIFNDIKIMFQTLSVFIKKDSTEGVKKMNDK